MLEDVWNEEVDKWQPGADISWASYSGICKRVATRTGKNGQPVYEVVASLRDNLEARWDTIICDEAHYLKGRNTTWTKVVANKLRSDRLFLATGTPLSNWGHEILMPLRLLFPGDRRFTNFWRWIGDHFKTWKPPWGGTQIQGLLRGLEWEQVAKEWGLADRWLRRTIDDVLPELPPMTRQTIVVDMTVAQGRAYAELTEEWLTTLPETGTEVVSWNDGGIYQKLLQCSTGLSTLDPNEPYGSGKLEALRDLMRDRQHPTIVFCVYTNTAEVVAKLMRELGKTAEVVSSRYSNAVRLDRIRQFRDGKLDVLVGTVGTLSEGVTLTRADTCIFVERSPRPVTNDQARRRIRRFGQERPTLSIDLVTRGTVDQRLEVLLEKKSQEIDLALTGFQLAALGT